MIPYLEVVLRIKPENIHSGFRKCGLVPWNRDTRDYSKTSVTHVSSYGPGRVFEGVEVEGKVEKATQVDFVFKPTKAVQTSVAVVSIPDVRSVLEEMNAPDIDVILKKLEPAITLQKEPETITPVTPGRNGVSPAFRDHFFYPSPPKSNPKQGTKKRSVINQLPSVLTSTEVVTFLHGRKRPADSPAADRPTPKRKCDAEKKLSKIIYEFEDNTTSTPESERQSLNQRLKVLNLVYVDNRKDGNCLFDAVSHQLDGQFTGSELRQKAVNELKVSRTEVIFYIKLTLLVL